MRRRRCRCCFRCRRPPHMPPPCSLSAPASMGGCLSCENAFAASPGSLEELEKEVGAARAQKQGPGTAVQGAACHAAAGTTASAAALVPLAPLPPLPALLRMPSHHYSSWLPPAIIAACHICHLQAKHNSLNTQAPKQKTRTKSGRPLLFQKQTTRQRVMGTTVSMAGMRMFMLSRGGRGVLSRSHCCSPRAAAATDNVHAHCPLPQEDNWGR